MKKYKIYNYKNKYIVKVSDFDGISNKELDKVVKKEIKKLDEKQIKDEEETLKYKLYIKFEDDSDFNFYGLYDTLEDAINYVKKDLSIKVYKITDIDGNLIRKGFLKGNK